MNLKDRLARGFAAGVAGGIAMNVISLTSYYLGIAELRFLDWAALVIYGTIPQNMGEVIFALLAQLIFVSVLGIVFAYLIPSISSINIFLRGWLYGVALWFLLYGISYLFKVEGTIAPSVGTAATDFIGSFIYGLVLAAALKWLDDRVDERV